MKKRHTFPVFVLTGVLALTCAGCGERATSLGTPAPATSLSYAERSDKGEEFASLNASANHFAYKFSADVSQKTQQNFAVSPVSVYLALALAAECASGETADELYAALGNPKTVIRAEFSDFYRGLIDEYRTNTNALEGEVILGNSVWIDESATVKEDCINMLAEKYHCYSYAADFANDNMGANKAVRKFVKEQTKKLIDRDFELDEETLFALMNTLYLKDVWQDFGRDLPFADGDFTFRSDGGEEPVRLLQGFYRAGRAVETDTYTHFYTATKHGYKLKFILPKDGHTAEEVFTSETLAAINSADYRADDEATRTHYHTRCLFPEFSAGYDADIKEILRGYGIERLFIDPFENADMGCDFSALTDDPVYCSKVLHVSQLNVTRKGIEGAAVTMMVGAGAPGPDGWENVYLDFPVDRSFGFILTDPYDVVLFSGIIQTP